MENLRALVTAASVGACLLLACGGSSAPVATPAATADAGPAESFAEVHPDDLAAIGAGPGGGTTGTGTAASDAGAAAPAHPPGDPVTGAPASSGGGDACTPIGVELEKAVRPKLKDCYAQAKKKTPNGNLEGTVKIKIEVAISGKVKSIKVVEKTLPEPVAQCMLSVVKAHPLPADDAEKCRGLSIIIPMTFPTPR